MKRLLLCLSLPLASLCAQGFNNGLIPTQHTNKYRKLNRILVENRVLSIVNNQPISVIDVVKRMDANFLLESPHLLDSDIARYHYYRSRWKAEFDHMVDTELIMQDADAHKMDATTGEVRQEIEKRFGSEVITNIDQVGLSYDEVWDLVKKDILTQKMAQRFFYLRGVFTQTGTFNISPNDLLSSYHKYIQKNKRPDQWSYYMISFTGPNAVEDAQMAKQKLVEFSNKHNHFKTISLVFQDLMKEQDKNCFSISQEIGLPTDKIQPTHREILRNLQAHSFSEPFKEVSRAHGEPVYRLIYLSSYKPAEAIELSEVEDQLTLELKNEKIEQAYQQYVTTLREKSGLVKETVYESIPSDFEPFKLR